MNAIPLRTLLSVVLLLLMTGASAAVDLQGWVFCDMLPYNIQAVVSEVKMKDATLEEAVACIQAAAIKAEGTSHNHVNVVVLGKAVDPSKRISLDLKRVPLKLALEEVARSFGMRIRTESCAVVLAPVGSPEPIHTRTYRVPPDFISTGSAAK